MRAALAERAEDRRVALRRVPRALRRASARDLDAIGVRYELDADARARARLLHAHDLRVHRAEAIEQLDDLRRRPLRRPDRGDRRPADARASASAPASSGSLLALERGGSDRRASQRIDVFFVVEDGAPRERVARAARRAAARGRRGRHRLRRPLAQGPAHAGRRASAPRRPSSSRRRTRRSAAAASGRRGRSRTTTVVARLSRMSWRDLMCGEPRARARRASAHARRLGRAPARPRRSRLRRPARPHGHPPARDQPGARARGGRRSRTRSATSSSSRREGEVVARAPETVNPNMPTGEVELAGRRARDRLALDAAAVPARRGERRRDAAPALPLARPAPRQAAAQHPSPRADGRDHPPRRWRRPGFLDIQTPILSKPTPEGARDFVVPSRLQPGRFFALAAVARRSSSSCSMIAGFDRYYQIAICFRDEDLRADRVQEITPARRRDGVPGPRGPVRADGGDVRRDLARVPRRRDSERRSRA